jgi:hypothetical protein
MAATVRGVAEQTIVPIAIYRASDLFNSPAVEARPASNGRPARKARPARRGLLNVGKSHFYDEIEPRLERVPLGDRAVGYTDRSVNRLIEEGIATEAKS